MENPSSEPNPALVFRSFIAFQKTAAIKAAIDLDLFTAIGAGACTVKELAQRCRASERGVRILCDYLVVRQFLSKEGDRYSLTPTAATFLDRGSPICIASAIQFLSSPTQFEAFGGLTAAVRKGGTALGEEGSLAPEHTMWVDFARAMAPIATLNAQLLANLLEASAGRRWKVLDIAAGHGMFGVTLAQHNPNAEIVALDWPNVLAVAEENARGAGVANRFRKIPGSALTVDYGNGYDLVLLTNFLHHFDTAGCAAILRKVHRSLKTGGRAVALEFVPDEDRVAPPDAAAFAIVMLATTPSGDAYTFAEYERMFRNAGFSRSELREIPPSFQRVVISYKE